jgi:molecular chaperone GrpE (heat shock protein)
MWKTLVFWLTHGQKVEELALRAQTTARDLNKLPASATESKENLVEILQSTNALLARLAEQQQTNAPVIVPSPEKISSQETAPSKLEQSEPSAVPHAEKEQGLSTTAKELMKLSDWVLLAKEGGATVQPEVLEEIYRRLTVVLAKEGVTSLDAGGPCDYERQMVVGTHPTDDPTQNDHVYSTVRPGYLFHDQLIRPQEVIIYTI